jgi:hypothetical protein
MYAFGFAWKYRAILFGVVADSYHVIERLPGKLVDRFRSVRTDIDVDLPHRLDRLRPDEAGDGAGTVDIEAVAGNVPQKTLGHLAAGGVSGAEDEDAFSIGHIVLRRRSFSGIEVPL